MVTRVLLLDYNYVCEPVYDHITWYINYETLTFFLFSPFLTCLHILQFIAGILRSDFDKIFPFSFSFFFFFLRTEALAASGEKLSIPYGGLEFGQIIK